MALYKTFLVLGLASVSPFSNAQEIVERGNQRFPHQPPLWFSAMASPSRPSSGPLDSFIVSEKSPSGHRAKFSGGIKYPCLKSNEKDKEQWQFCDM